jgi:hypothetical protein
MEIDGRAHESVQRSKVWRAIERRERPGGRDERLAKPFQVALAARMKVQSRVTKGPLHRMRRGFRGAGVTANRFAWSRWSWLGTDDPLVAGLSPAGPIWPAA